MKRTHKRETNREKDKRKMIIILLLIVLILSAVFLCLKTCSGVPLFTEPSPTPVYLADEGDSMEGEAESTDREEILKELEKKQLVVTDKLSSNITFSSGEQGVVGEWIVENPELNTVIMQAEVYLNDVMIAKSTPIYPNQHITAVSLLSEIETGEYEVTAYLNYYDIETKEFISKAGYRIHLTVKD